MKKLISIAGLLVFCLGIFWMGQGLGYIKWPPSSFMISQSKWVYYGAYVACIGLLFIWFGRRPA